MDTLVVGEEGCTFKNIVDVFSNDVNSAALFETWRDFARELKINSGQIKKWSQDTLVDKLAVKDVLHQILESWRSKRGKDATLQDLLTNLEKVKLKNVADDLREFFAIKNRVEISGQFSNSMLPKKPNHYIPRTLVTRSVINVRMISSTQTDVFVLDGIGRNQLSRLANNELTDNAKNQVCKDKLSVRFISLENFGDWALLCNKTTNPIHLLRHREGKFDWLCTKGDISALQKASDEKNQNELSEEDFIDKIETDLQFQTNQPICISDSPGMGKSLLLASIGRRLQQRYPQRCIAFIVISEFVVKIKELLPEFDNKDKVTLEALLRLLCENNSSQKTLVQKITTPTENPSTQVELMFDGFDEVSTENFDLAYECLETLTANFSSTVRVWVTTRPQHLQKLEESFCVLGYNIQAFQEKHQLDFLNSYWTSPQKQLDWGKLQCFAINCLRTLKEKLNKKDEDIAGIPLQCMMIAEVYMQDAHRFCDSKNKKLENWSETAAPCIDIISIADLYKKLIEHKIQKFIGTYPVVIEQNCILSWHMYPALKLIFPFQAHKFKDALQISSGIKEEDLVNVGILERRRNTTKGAVRFVHRTFAEYLAARFFVSQVMASSTTDLQNPSKTLPNFLFQHMLENSVEEHHSWATTYFQCSFKHSVLCHFINALLRSKKHIPAKSFISEESTKYIKAVIYACIHSDFGNILKFLRENLKYPGSLSINRILNSDAEILIDATRVASLDLLQFLMESFKHKALTAIEGGQYPSMLTALHAAVRRGSYSIFEYIYKQHQFEYSVKKDKKFMDLVHCAVIYTARLKLDEIQDRVQILEALCELNREMINYCDENKRTPLLATEVHILLLKKLVECGANLLCSNHCKDTILHHATYYLSPADYYEFLLHITQIPDLISLLQMRNKDDQSSFHLIVKRGFATRDILNRIKSTGFDINRNGKWGRTCIFYTLEMENEEMTIPTVKLLLENGADHTTVSDFEDSIVHYSAMKGRIDCLRFFLEEKKMDVNQINCRGETSIFHALRNFNSALETVKFLHERGADHTILNSNGDNLLYYSTKYHQMECLKFFLNLGGLDINQRNNDGNTPLMCSLRWNHEKIVDVTRLLLDKGANLRIYNNNGNNVLHRAARIGSAEWFRQFAGLLSLDVNARNYNQDTPLHLVFKNIDNYARRCDDYTSFLYIIENLLLLGADVNAKNNTGETPLDIYQREMWKSNYKEELIQKNETIRGLLEGKEQENHTEKDNVQYTYYSILNG